MVPFGRRSCGNGRGHGLGDYGETLTIITADISDKDSDEDDDIELRCQEPKFSYR